MAIEFTCPNGHRLSTPVDHAGRMAKCPRCGTVTRIPDLDGEGSRIVSAEPAPSSSGKLPSKSGTNLAAGSGVGAAVSDAPVSSAVSGSGPKLGAGGSQPNGSTGVVPTGESDKAAAAKPAALREPQIVFLCPNGHKLNAPSRLQGHAGKCPHCGEKFRIPLMDEPAGGDGGQQPADNNPADVANIYQQILDQAASPAAVANDMPHGLAPSRADELTFDDPDWHPLARLVIRLWSEREHGGIVELHLSGGAILVPEWFEKQLSKNSHGLFASQSADGTVTMTIVPWDSITRVVVRGVVGLPDGMFE